jgi:hypothetical protein
VRNKLTVYEMVEHPAARALTAACSCAAGSQKLRERAGLPEEPTGPVADSRKQAKRSTKKASSRAEARA